MKRLLIRLVRKIQWPFVQSSAATAASAALSPLVCYPVIIWLEFSAREEYLELGAVKFNKRLVQKAEEFGNAVISAAIPDHLRPIEQRRNSITQSIACTQARKQEGEKELDEMIARCDKLPVVETSQTNTRKP